MIRLLGLAACLVFVACGAARADIVVGALLSTTGPSASLGIPERNAIDLLPQSIGGEKIRYVVLDDGSDTTAAVKNAQKLINEEHADVILGPSNTPNSLAVLDVIGPAGVPMISLAGSSAIIEPQDANRRWAFKLAPTEAIMLRLVGADIVRKGGKTVAIIKVANSFGDAMAGAMEKDAAARGLKLVDEESYNWTDMSVTPQVLKLIASHPDAIFVGSSGTPGVLPVIELRNRGYTGPIYNNQGVANPDVLRVGGKSLEGMMLPASPVLVAEQLPPENPIRAVSLDYIKLYEGKYGEGSRSLFGASVFDAFVLLQQGIPRALKAGTPGTAAFRAALRDAMEHSHELAGTQGGFNLTPTDHSGADERAQVLVAVKNGQWQLVK
jgi:branched-chain amino acid transport system substrate-binding protein